MTPGTIAHHAPLSMGFSRQEHWSGLPFPSPGDLPDPGIEPRSPALQADALTSEPPGEPSSHGHQQIQSMHLCVCDAAWTIAHQAPLSIGFSGQKYWSGLPFPSPGDLPIPEVEPTSPASPALAGGY